MSGETMQRVAGPCGAIAVHLIGDRSAPAVVMTHSILTSSRMWDGQAAWLAREGWRVVRIDTRGHGGSACVSTRCTMDDLAADTMAVLDALGIERAHYVGLSLGGMSGFAFARLYRSRVASLCICDARADAPPDYAAPWDERIAIAQREGTRALAEPTLERWFGKAFLEAHPAIAQQMRAAVSATSVDGFVACARAIQQLNELDAVGCIAAPTTFIVGARDGVLPDVMAELRSRVLNARLEVIPDAGHLPNIEQPAAFDAALRRHLERAAAAQRT